MSSEIQWDGDTPICNMTIVELERQILEVEGIVVIFRHPKKQPIKVTHYKGYFRYLNNPVREGAKVRDVFKRIARIVKDEYEFVAIRNDGTVALQTDFADKIKRK